MSETDKTQIEKSKPFRFFYLEGRKRFKASELAVSEVMATLSDLKWLREELEEKERCL